MYKNVSKASYKQSTQYKLKEGELVDQTPGIQNISTRLDKDKRKDLSKMSYKDLAKQQSQTTQFTNQQQEQVKASRKKPSLAQKGEGKSFISKTLVYKKDKDKY